MRSVLVSDALLSKKLSKRNLEDLQDHISSLPQPDNVLEWILLTPTMTSSEGLVAKKKRLIPTLPSIASSGSHIYSRSYAHTLYLLGISDVDNLGIIPEAPNHPEVSNLLSGPSDHPLLSTYLTNWILEYEPNEESLTSFLCSCVFEPEDSNSYENVTILLEFSGPFKSHHLHELKRGNQAIKYPIIKRDLCTEELNILQTHAELDLRARSNLVFAASTSIFGESVRATIKLCSKQSSIPGLSNNLLCCAVAIVVEVKAISTTASVTSAKSQWISLAYLQMMERVSVSREATYVGDEDICQYGYGICGSEVRVWKMGLKWNKSKRRYSEVLDSYFTFPVQIVGMFDLEIQDDFEGFITLHKKLLRWWLGGYIPSYVRDITNNVVAHPYTPNKWRTTWQEAVANFKPEEDLEIEDLFVPRFDEQPAGPLFGPENEAENIYDEIGLSYSF